MVPLPGTDCKHFVSIWNQLTSQTMLQRHFFTISTILLTCPFFTWTLTEYSIPKLNTFDVERALEISCVVAADVLASEATLEILDNLTNAFKLDPGVTVGLVRVDKFTWSTGIALKTDPKEGHVPFDKSFSPLLVFGKEKRDRSCLHASPPWNPKAHYYQGVMDIRHVVDYVNYMCGTYRRSDGQLSNAGHHRKHILQDLFHVGMLTDSVSMGDLCGNNPLNTTFVWRKQKQNKCSIFKSDKGGMEHDTCDTGNVYTTDKPTQMPECDRISIPTRDEFFNKYLKRSQPVIIEGAVKEWPAYIKWTNEYFKNQFSDEKVHIKLTPTGDFEGVEKAEQWEDYVSFKIPEKVKKQLLFPDLVVVRPATRNMRFSEFLDLINSTAHQENPPLSAYLEYSSLSDAMPGAEDDVIEPEFMKRLLTRQHLNVWLSDGNTLGRLHFDPFDNLLAQLRGQKQVTLFPPDHNENLYEAHIPQAILKYNHQSGEFRRHGLEESTSMVMSPVDLLNPDFERFPMFASAHPLNCTLQEGDILYMPSFWWHEVKSSPNLRERRNLAVNFWYEPFLHKEFPCQSCRLDVNPRYNHLLEP